MSTGLVWFRQNDLRVHDNKPLHEAHANNERVIHMFCYDPRIFKASVDFDESLFPTQWRKTGPMRRRFIDESVHDLTERIEQLSNGKSTLLVSDGKPEDVIPTLVQKYNITKVYCTQGEASEEAGVERKVTRRIRALTLAGGRSPQVVSHWGGTLYDPESLPFDVYRNFPNTASNFRTKTRGKVQVPDPLPSPMVWRESPCCAEDAADDLALTRMPKPANGGSNAPDLFSSFYKGGETAGLERVKYYIWDKQALPQYKETRNGMLGQDFSSKWSPWLAAGCVSVRSIYHDVRAYEQQHGVTDGTKHMIFELEVREYFRYYCESMGNAVFHLHGPKAKLSHKNNGASVQWKQDIASIRKWCAGETGNPMIDANMKELALTGYMSNRGRQIVASYLTRDMGQDWRYGAMWFESMLIDHDVCQNWGNWTYAAGVGSDPREDRYFSIPRQTERYDPDHAFIRHWLTHTTSTPSVVIAGIADKNDSVWGDNGSKVPPSFDAMRNLLGRGTRKRGGPRGGNNGRGGGKFSKNRT